MDLSTEIKIVACRDCKHCFGNVQCDLFPIKEWDAYDGELVTMRYALINDARLDGRFTLSWLSERLAVDNCGRAGKLFEPKSTLATKLRDFWSRIAIMLHCAVGSN